jgi:hypothetical protein
MVELVHEIDRAIFNPVWQQVRIPAPWGDDGETLGAVRAPRPHRHRFRMACMRGRWG